MRPFILFLIGFMVVGLAGCKKDDKEGTLTFHFKATYDGQPLQTFSTLPFENGEQLQFTHLSMMLSDLQIGKSSQTVNLTDIELIDLSFDNLGDAQDGQTLTFTGIPAASYTGLRIGVGVPPDLNSKKPADFSSGHPLSLTGYYWIPWNSYIFSKIEGRLDTLGSGALDLGFAMHVGSDALYRVLDSDMIPITIEDGKVTAVTIAIDFKKLLEGVDIKFNPQNHSPQDTVNIYKIVNNLSTAVILIP